MAEVPTDYNPTDDSTGIATRDLRKFATLFLNRRVELDHYVSPVSSWQAWDKLHVNFFRSSHRGTQEDWVEFTLPSVPDERIWAVRTLRQGEALVDIPRNAGERVQCYKDLLAAEWAVVDADSTGQPTQQLFLKLVRNVYHGPNDDVTVEKPPGANTWFDPGDGQYKKFSGTEKPWQRRQVSRFFSNASAVDAIRCVLGGEWALGPLDEPPDRLRLWADVECRWTSDGRLCEVKAAHELERACLSYFQCNDDAGWDWVHRENVLDRVIEGSGTSYRLHLTVEEKRPPRIFVEKLVGNRSEEFQSEWYHVVADARDELVSKQNHRHVESVLDDVLGKRSANWSMSRSGVTYSVPGKHSYVQNPDAEEVFQKSPYLLYIQQGAAADRRWVYSLASEDAETREKMMLHLGLAYPDPKHRPCMARFIGEAYDQRFPRDWHLFMETSGTMRDLIRQRLATQQYIPEIFIWLTLQSLVKACDSLRRLEGKELVPFNITLDDIVIQNSVSTTEYFPGFPNAVLRRFGNTIQSHKSIEKSPRYNCKIGFRTPEHVGYKRIPVTALSTYSIGIIIYCMMRRLVEGLPREEPAHSKDQLFPDVRGENLISMFPYWPKDDPKIYSSSLETLVKSCLDMMPNRRPHLESIQTAIDFALKNWEMKMPGVSKRTVGQLPRWMRIDIMPSAVERMP